MRAGDPSAFVFSAGMLLGMVGYPLLYRHSTSLSLEVCP